MAMDWKRSGGWNLAFAAEIIARGKKHKEQSPGNDATSGFCIERSA